MSSWDASDTRLQSLEGAGEPVQTEEAFERLLEQNLENARLLNHCMGELRKRRPQSEPQAPQQRIGGVAACW